jgi:hypothetical protein
MSSEKIFFAATGLGLLAWNFILTAVMEMRADKLEKDIRAFAERMEAGRE